MYDIEYYLVIEKWLNYLIQNKKGDFGRYYMNLIK